MLSKAKIKFIKSLQIKKYRKQEQCFIVQGAKSVQELLTSDFETVTVIGTAPALASLKSKSSVELIETGEKELGSLSEFQTNDSVLAVARIKSAKAFHPRLDEFVLVLDDIRDPGNLGTIIRTADWYGINHIVASPETADFYNPKVISATMGSFTRTTVYYVDLLPVLSQTNQKVYGAYLEGKNIHQERFSDGGLVLIGNESHGISPQYEKFVTDKITIPRFGHAESLNAAIATAIICDNLRRGDEVRGERDEVRGTR
ncbi:MAG TPA: RNA methyltransferase [Ohtaekwangia sp.]|nr:RNA methyltransferase [Ohtaekwangia sp.]